MTGGARHVTDATNAARTLLYNVSARGGGTPRFATCWVFRWRCCPRCLDCAADFGVAGAELLGAEVPILGVAGRSAGGDRRAGVFPGRDAEIDIRDGVFRAAEHGRHAGDLAKPAAGDDCLSVRRGADLCAGGLDLSWPGAVVQWLRDGLQIIADATETQPLAESADAGQDVVLVPAFTGHGRAVIGGRIAGARCIGLTRNSGPAEIGPRGAGKCGLSDARFAGGNAVRTGRPTMRKQRPLRCLRVDGGMSASDWAMQFLSDIIDAPVDRPEVLETTALGAAWLAGMRAGIYPDQAGFAEDLGAGAAISSLQMDDATRAEKYDRWGRAVQATLGRLRRAEVVGDNHRGCKACRSAWWKDAPPAGIFLGQ